MPKPIKASKDRLILLLMLMHLGTLRWSQYSFTILKILRSWGIIPNQSFLGSVKGTESLDDGISVLQHGLLNISNPLLRSTSQEKKVPFKILLLINNAFDHLELWWRCTWVSYLFFMLAKHNIILQCMDQRSYWPPRKTFCKYEAARMVIPHGSW